VIVGILISVRLATASCREIGAGVVSPLAPTLPARDGPARLEVGGMLSEVGEAAVAGIDPRAGVDDLEDSEGDSFLFLFDISPLFVNLVKVYTNSHQLMA